MASENEKLADIIAEMRKVWQAVVAAADAIDPVQDWAIDNM